MENLPNRLEQVMEYDTVQKIRQYPIGDNETAAEFVIPYTDHTVATIISEEIRELKGVHYAGIREPHPFETSMFIRIHKDQNEQTVEDVLIDAVKNAVTNIKSVIEDYEDTLREVQ